MMSPTRGASDEPRLQRRSFPDSDRDRAGVLRRQAVRAEHVKRVVHNYKSFITQDLPSGRVASFTADPANNAINVTLIDHTRYSVGYDPGSTMFAQSSPPTPRLPTSRLQHRAQGLQHVVVAAAVSVALHPLLRPVVPADEQPPGRRIEGDVVRKSRAKRLSADSPKSASATSPGR